MAETIHFRRRGGVRACARIHAEIRVAPLNEDGLEFKMEVSKADDAPTMTVAFEVPTP